MKRLFDITLSTLGLILTSPVFVIISLMIMADSRGGIFYKGKRLGKNQKPFGLYKFRTMYPNSDKSSITVGNRDPRITPVGYWLRKYKLDELPQLINVLKGEMSFVGPRPDVPKYAKYYQEQMPRFFEMKPGITSYSSIFFSDESEIYRGLDNPEKVYIEDTIPKKLKLDKAYFDNQNLLTDLKIIGKTLTKIFIKGNQ